MIIFINEMTEENNCYPFGLKHKGYNGNVVSEHPYKFQGQELTEELDFNMYEFKWRMHDPAIGRFMQIDPLAEDYVHNGTYNFSENRVIDAIELEGLEALDYRVLMETGYKAITSSKKNIVINNTIGVARREVAKSQTDNPQEQRRIDKKGTEQNFTIAEEYNKGVSDYTKGAIVESGEFLKDAGGVVEDAGYALAIPTEGASLALVPIGEGMQKTGSTMQICVYASDGDQQAVIDETLSMAMGVVSSSATEKIVKPINNSVGDKVGKTAQPLIEKFVNWLIGED